MNDKAIAALKDYLDHECDDYGMQYTWEWDDGGEYFDVTVSLEYTDRKASVYFRYKANKLSIELGEDCWYQTEWWENTVKYFWMIVSPKLWSD